MQVLLLTVLTTLGLLAFSFLDREISLFGITAKKIDILSDLRRKEPADPPGSMKTVKAGKAAVAPDSGTKTRRLSLADTTDGDGNLSDASAENYLLQPAQLGAFFEALKGLRDDPGEEQVRIAYYGDSQIEGDLITKDLRELFQKEFGGKSFGYVPITSNDAPFRLHLKHTFSGNWKTCSIKESSRMGFGIGGSVSVPNGNCWVKYEVPSAEGFSELRLFYDSPAGGALLRYALDGQAEETVQLASTADLKEVRIRASSGGSRTARFFLPKEYINLYGVSLENGGGVYLDGFPLRGNSGLGLLKIPVQQMKSFSHLMNYKLIVLHFGVNVANTNTTGFAWYERGMINVINQIKEAFPGASILLVSAADRSMKVDGEYVTLESIPLLVESQKKIAAKMNIGFFNLYEAMGGRNSMADWVEQGLAARDYIHFSRSGGRKVAQLIYRNFQHSYNKYMIENIHQKQAGN